MRRSFITAATSGPQHPFSLTPSRGPRSSRHRGATEVLSKRLTISKSMTPSEFLSWALSIFERAPDSNSTLQKRGQGYDFEEVVESGWGDVEGSSRCSTARNPLLPSARGKSRDQTAFGNGRTSSVDRRSPGSARGLRGDPEARRDVLPECR